MNNPHLDYINQHKVSSDSGTRITVWFDNEQPKEELREFIRNNYVILREYNGWSTSTQQWEEFKIEERKPEASMVECNHGGIEISLHPSGDAVYWRRNWGEDAITEWKEAEIKYSDEDDGQYFNIDNDEYKYFLSEFMRYDR